MPNAPESTSPAIAAWSVPPSCGNCAIASEPAPATLAPPEILTRTHAELDLTNQAAVDAFFAKERPDQVFLAAAKVGGIHANNSYPAEFIYENLMIEANIIHAAYTHGVRTPALPRLQLHLPPTRAAADERKTPCSPAPLEPTNEPYAIAKIAGIKLCESYNRQYGTDYSQRHADQPLRPRRQLRPAEQPRHSGADPQAAPGADSPPNTTGRRSKTMKPGTAPSPKTSDASSTTPAPARSSLA